MTGLLNQVNINTAKNTVFKDIFLTASCIANQCRPNLVWELRLTITLRGFKCTDF